MDKAFYAKVKFLDDNDVRVVPTKKIVEYQIKNPSNIEDFDKKKIYTCMWSDDKNPEEIELPIQISHLAVINSLEDLEEFKKKNRGIFGKLDQTIIDEYYDTSNEKTNSKKNSNTHLVIKTKNENYRKKAKNAEKVIHQDILQERMNILINSNLSTKEQGTRSPVKFQLPEVQENSVEDVIKSLKKENEIIFKKYQCLFNENKDLQKKLVEEAERSENYRLLNEKLQEQATGKTTSYETLSKNNAKFYTSTSVKSSDVIMKYNIGHLKDSLNNLSESTSVKSPEKISKGKHFDKKNDVDEDNFMRSTVQSTPPILSNHEDSPSLIYKRSRKRLLPYGSPDASPNFKRTPSKVEGKKSNNEVGNDFITSPAQSQKSTLADNAGSPVFSTKRSRERLIFDSRDALQKYKRTSNKVERKKNDNDQFGDDFTTSPVRNKKSTLPYHENSPDISLKSTPNKTKENYNNEVGNDFMTSPAQSQKSTLADNAESPVFSDKRSRHRLIFDSRDTLQKYKRTSNKVGRKQNDNDQFGDDFTASPVRNKKSTLPYHENSPDISLKRTPNKRKKDYDSSDDMTYSSSKDNDNLKTKKGTMIKSQNASTDHMMPYQQ